MTVSRSFKSQGKFSPDQFYPLGISSSSDYTDHEAKILERHGQAFQALEIGNRDPINEEEKDFVAVCLGKKTAETDYEKAWAKYRSITKNRRSR